MTGACLSLHQMPPSPASAQPAMAQQQLNPCADKAQAQAHPEADYSGGSRVLPATSLLTKARLSSLCAQNNGEKMCYDACKA